MYHCHGNAVRILRGRETEPTQVYDRYEDPGKWPKLPLISKKSPYSHTGLDKGEGGEYKATAPTINKGLRKDGEEFAVKKTLTQESRARETDSRHANERNRFYRYKQQQNNANIWNTNANRSRGNEDNSISQHWKLFNTRSHEITKDRYGIALERPRYPASSKGTEAEAWKCESDDEREESELPERIRPTIKTIGSFPAQELTTELAISLLQCIEENQELRKSVFALLEERKRKKTGSGERYLRSSKDEEKAESDRKKKRLDRDEFIKKSSKIVEDIKRKYWKDRRRRGSPSLPPLSKIR